MARFWLLLCASAAACALATEAPAAGWKPPQWLLRAEHTLLVRGFENAKPVHVYYIRYPRKIAVVFEFRHVVVCGMCSAPTNASLPRGRVLRVSFDRKTHRLGGASDGWAIRFCEVTGNEPPKSSCLRR